MRRKIENIIDRFKNFRAYSSERAQYFSGEPEARYRFASRFTAGKKVLDVGCSLGCGTNYLALHGAREVIGIDYSKAAVAEARKNYPLSNVRFLKLQAGEMRNLQENFDVVVAFEIIEHLKNSEARKFLCGSAEILCKGGIFLLSTPNKLVSSPNREKPLNPYHVKEYSPEEISDLLKEYFFRVEILGIKCKNQEYLQRQKFLEEKSWRYRALKYFGQSWFVRGMAAFVPVKARQRMTGESNLPELKSSDFFFDDSKIGESKSLFAVCKKQD